MASDSDSRAAAFTPTLLSPGCSWELLASALLESPQS